MTYPSRPTVYLSASLLLLPSTAHSADAPGWSCQPAASGGWSCAAASTIAAPVAAEQETASQPPLATPATVDTPATAVPLAPALPPLPQKGRVEEVRKSAAAPTPISASLQKNNWNWVSADDAPTDAQCYQPNPACDGVYVEPIHNWEDVDKSPDGQPARASAAHAEWEGDLIKMDGGVTVTQGNTRLTADRAEMERSSGRLKLFGDVALEQPHLKISGSNADMTTSNNFGHVVDAQLLDYKAGIRVTADKLTRRKENLLELERATYTRCPPDREDWRLDSRRIRMNRETGRGEASDTVIRVADLPVFYTPYINFPIDDRRQTGFLWPLFSKSSSGFDIAAPYYLNLGPNYDATLTPRVITDRGNMLEAEGRYLNQYSSWVLSGAELRNDQNTDTDRWFYGLQEGGNLNSYFSTRIDYSRVSDNDYFRDFSISSVDIKRQTSLNQQAALNLNYINWSASLQVQQYQTIDELVAEPYRKAPQFTISRSADGANFEPDYNLLAEATRFDHNNPNSVTDPGSPWIIGDRVYLEPGVSFPMRWTESFLNPELRLRYVGYNLTRPDTQPGDTKPETMVPQAILDSGVFFERDTALFGNAYQQTLEPRLYYLYSPYKDQTDQPLFDTSPLTFDYQQLFQPHRLVGHDRLEDFNQLSTGVTSRIIDDISGSELGRASIGQIFYFSEQRVDASTVESVNDQPRSAIAGQLVLQPVDSFWAAGNILWDQSNNQIQQGNASVHYDIANGSIFNVAYRYNQPNPTVSTLANGLRQIDSSLAVPLNQRWRLLARLNYDLDLDSTLEDLIGLEYQDCCWLMRVAYHRAALAEELDTLGNPVLEREDTFMVEFQLKGLAGLGQKMNTLLQESIWGYRDRY